MAALLGFPLVTALELVAERIGNTPVRRAAVPLVAFAVLWRFYALAVSNSEPLNWTRFWHWAALRQVHWKPRALIIDMEDVPVIDSTGIRALGEVIRQARNEGTVVLIADLQPGPRATLLGSPLAALFGPGQLDYRFDDAVEAVGLTGEQAITPG